MHNLARTIIFILLISLLIPLAPNAKAVSCGNLSGGNDTYRLCNTYTLKHTWSRTDIQLVNHGSKVAKVEVSNVSSSPIIFLSVNKPSGKLYLKNYPGKYIELTYLGMGKYNRAKIKIDSNTTQADLLLPLTQPTQVEVLKSKYFKNNLQAKKIVEKNQTYDLSANGIWDFTNYELRVDSFSYKIFSSLLMIGYSHGRDMTPAMSGSNMAHLTLLNHFQKNNGLTVSKILDKKTLLKLDEYLSAREPRYRKIAKSFPLYSSTVDLHNNEVSKEYSAYLFQLAMDSLPKYLQLKSEYEWIECTAYVGQCVGKVIPNNSSIYKTKDIINNGYKFDTQYFTRSNLKYRDTLVYRPTVIVDTVLHEYAHDIDNDYGFKKTYNGANPTHSLIDTKSFYDISYKNFTTSTGILCGDHKNSDLKNFISYYAARAKYSCPSGKYVVLEDFAESFATYVTAGKQFRDAAKQNTVIDKKYNWLKTNVFKGVEYNTDLNRAPNETYDCKSVGGYLKCDNSYVWDGKIKTL